MQSSGFREGLPHASLRVAPELTRLRIRSGRASPLIRKRNYPGAVQPGQGSIQGSNLHETRDNSEQLKPHGNAEKQVHGTPGH
jgi:hypothetical protein